MWTLCIGIHLNDHVFFFFVRGSRLIDAYSAYIGTIQQRQLYFFACPICTDRLGPPGVIRRVEWISFIAMDVPLFHCFDLCLMDCTEVDLHRLFRSKYPPSASRLAVLSCVGWQHEQRSIVQRSSRRALARSEACASGTALDTVNTTQDAMELP